MEATIKVGEKVEHRKYGVGEVFKELRILIRKDTMRL